MTSKAENFSEANSDEGSSAFDLEPPDFGMLTTKEEWSAFVEYEPPTPPKVPDKHAQRSWSVEQKEAFDLRRIRHHAEFDPIKVPAMQRVHGDLLPQIKSNRFRRAGIPRRGGIIDGNGGVGKTTTLSHLGRKHELYVRRNHGCKTSEGNERVPVVYVTLPAATTIKGLSKALARFYGVVHSKHANESTITYNVIDHARRCKTELILVDDIHFLNLKNRADREVNDHLKFLANSVSATFVYAGIEVERSGLLSEGNPDHHESFSQIRRRFNLHRIEPFSLGRSRGQQEWASLLRTLERRLVLLEVSDGMLYQALYNYLFARTGGYIGSLVELVREGANRAIETGEERLTESLLDDVTLDYAAESESARRGVGGGEHSSRDGKSRRGKLA